MACQATWVREPGHPHGSSAGGAPAAVATVQAGNRGGPGPNQGKSIHISGLRGRETDGACGKTRTDRQDHVSMQIGREGAPTIKWLRITQPETSHGHGDITERYYVQGSFGMMT